MIRPYNATRYPLSLSGETACLYHHCIWYDHNDQWDISCLSRVRGLSCEAVADGMGIHAHEILGVSRWRDNLFMLIWCKISPHKHLRHCRVRGCLSLDLSLMYVVKLSDITTGVGAMKVAELEHLGGLVVHAWLQRSWYHHGSSRDEGNWRHLSRWSQGLCIISNYLISPRWCERWSKRGVDISVGSSSMYEFWVFDIITMSRKVWQKATKHPSGGMEVCVWLEDKIEAYQAVETI